MISTISLNDDCRLQEFCIKNNIRLYLTDTLTCKDKGFCFYDGDEYHVFINSKMSLIGQRKTMIHELIHIFEDHFSCDESEREECESAVHDIINKIYDFEQSVDLSFL